LKKWRFQTFLFMATAALLSVSFLGCAGAPNIPPEKQQYIEGRIIEGGAFGFRLIDDSGKQFRISAKGDAFYNPTDFHALYGDRLGVTYGPMMVGTEERQVALRVDLIGENPNRIEIESPTEGIIREAGKTRHKVHLIKYGLTVVLLYDRNITYQPDSWKPTDGNKVSIYISNQPGRFMEKRFFNRIDLLDKGPVPVEDETISGSVQEVRREHLTIWTQTGKAASVYVGGETNYAPADFEPASGDRVNVVFYRKLMGDRSIRLTATSIKKAAL
jgi:hypothetical protein